VFILLAEHPKLLLETIRSRVEELKFPGFARSDIPSHPQCLEAIKDLTTLQSTSLHERFEYAKTLAQSPGRTRDTLECWLVFLRTVLLEKAKGRSNISELVSIKDRLELTQETLTLCSTTNVNTRLALDRLMLELYKGETQNR